MAYYRDLAFWNNLASPDIIKVGQVLRLTAPPDASGSGKSVETSPIRSTAGLRGVPYATAYVAAKHALIGLTRALAEELAPKGITVNVVCPGYTDTELVSDAVTRIVAKTGRSAEAVLHAMISAAGQTRLVHPDEVVQAVMRFCDPSAEGITGQAVALMGEHPR